MNTGLTCVKVLALALRPGTEPVLYAGTDGGAVFRTSLPTAVAERPAPGSPASVVAVMPNPCRARAAIRLSGTPTSASRLTLSDATGRLVYSCAPRTREVLLSTARLTPGAYFVRFTDGTKPGFARLTVVE
jgi:hypothetical protein